MTMEASQLSAPTNTRQEREDRRLQELEGQLRDVGRRVESNRLIRDGWTLAMFAVAVVALLAGVIAVGLGLRAVDEAEANAMPTEPALAGR